METTALYRRYQAMAEAALEKETERCFAPDSRVGAAARYSLLGGGKRVRAVLCLAACEMLGGDTNTAASYAAGVEMLHCYSLIHDDLPCMDDDDLRRGRPSCHTAFDEATAMLAGDALLTAAFEVLARAPADPVQNVEAVRTLSSAAGARGMVLGQELDLAFESRPAGERELQRIHRCKTGMLINAAAQLGAIAARGTEEQRAWIAEYAFRVGMVFQIVDDILDVTATEQQLGKSAGSDAVNGKTTFVTLYGEERSCVIAQQLTAEACSALSEAFGDQAEFLVSYARNLLCRTN